MIIFDKPGLGATGIELMRFLQACYCVGMPRMDTAVATAYVVWRDIPFACRRGNISRAISTVQGEKTRQGISILGIRVILDVLVCCEQGKIETSPLNIKSALMNQG